MKITGPFLDKKKRGQPSPWYLRYAAPKQNSDGTTVLLADGRPMMQRHRPFYESKAKAQADILRISEQYGATGTGTFLFDRKAAEQFETAKKIVPQPLADIEQRRQINVLVQRACWLSQVFFRDGARDA